MNRATKNVVLNGVRNGDATFVTISLPRGTTLRSGSETILEHALTERREPDQDDDHRKHRLHEPRAQLEEVRHEGAFRELFFLGLVVVGRRSSSRGRRLVGRLLRMRRLAGAGSGAGLLAGSADWPAASSGTGLLAGSGDWPAAGSGARLVAGSGNALADGSGDVECAEIASEISRGVEAGEAAGALPGLVSVPAGRLD